MACRDMRALEEWASIHRFWRLRWKLRYPTPVSKHNEATESTNDICLGFPCDLVAVICISVRSHIDRSGGRACVGYGSGSTYSVQIFATALFGNHAAVLGSPLNSARSCGCISERSCQPRRTQVHWP